MSDTPRTDAACHDVYAQGVAHIPLVGFMEQMERELAAALKTLTDIRQLFVDDDSFGSVVERLFAKPLEEAESELAEVTKQRDAAIKCHEMCRQDRKRVMEQRDTLADAITNFQIQFDRISWHWDGDCGAQDMADELFEVLAAVKGEKP